MKRIKFSDFQIIPILESAKRLKISDEEYFSKTYSGYISNSRMGYINPAQNGTPEKYKNPPKLSTSSLSLGSAVHELVLQPESFLLGPKCGKPTAKLGATLDRIKYYRNQNYSIKESIIKAAIDCDYFVNQIESKIKAIIKSGFEYYWKTRNLDNSYITLSDKEWDACNKCVKSIQENQYIQSVLKPKTFFSETPSFNEDAIFLDVVVLYKNKHTTLKLKMKADNWTIDEENKTLVLNDLKTTSKPCVWFMNPEYGSFYHYHYYRQFALYMMMLQQYCIKEYGFNDKWDCFGNVLVVNTVDYNTRLCKVSSEQMLQGKKEYEELLKRIAYYEIFGYDTEVNFID